MDKHHITPRYMGGSDTAENLVSVTRTQHVMWHYANWTLWGNTEDFIAYRGLAGTISGHEISQEVRSMNGKRSAENKTGLFALPEADREENSRRGGIKGGKQMKDYIWITNGESNTRIRLGMLIPEGWTTGVTRKNKSKPKEKRYSSVEDWNETQKERSLELRKDRAKDLVSVDLTKRGSITRLSELWGVSRAQVKRYLNKLMLPTGIEPV